MFIPVAMLCRNNNRSLKHSEDGREALFNYLQNIPYAEKGWSLIDRM